MIAGIVEKGRGEGERGRGELQLSRFCVLARDRTV